eukprot:scaffold27989_cov94-Isochrysis_galbana.AAC.4
MEDLREENLSSQYLPSSWDLPPLWPQPRRVASPAAPDARRLPPGKPRMGGASNARCRWLPPPLGRRLSAAARWPSLDDR